MTATLPPPPAPPPPAPPGPAPAVRPPSPGARRAWRVVGALLAVLALGWGTLQVVVLLAHSERSFERVLTGDVGEVRVSIDAGSLRIVATDGPEVRVSARVSDGLVSTDHREEVEGSAVVLESSCPPVLSTFCSIDYVVEVPRSVSVRIRTETAPVTVTGTRGSLDVGTDTGAIRLIDTDGDVVARTDTGAVTLDDVVAARTDVRTDIGSVTASYLEDPRSVVVRTDTGSVEIVLPDADTTYRLEADSGNGSVTTPVRTDPDAQRSVDVRSDVGSITVTYASR